MGITETDVRALFDDLAVGAQAWIDGHTEDTAASTYGQADDMTIYGPFGGDASRMGPGFADVQKRVASKFRGGTCQCELVSWMASGDLAVLVLIERSTVTFEGRTEPQPWVLRTTQVFRRVGDGWLRLHRHADPLIKRRSFDETLDLAAQTS